MDYLTFLALIGCNRWWFNLLSVPFTFAKLPALTNLTIRSNMIYFWNASISSNFYFQFVAHLKCYIKNPFLYFCSTMPRWEPRYLETYEGSIWILRNSDKFWHFEYLQNVLLYKLFQFNAFDEQVQVHNNLYYYRLKSNLLHFSVVCKNFVAVRTKVSVSHLHYVCIKEYVENIVFWFSRLWDDDLQAGGVSDDLDEGTFAISAGKRLIWITDNDFTRLRFMFDYSWFTSRVTSITMVFDWSAWDNQARNTMDRFLNTITFPLLKEVDLIGVYRDKSSFKPNARMWTWLERNFNNITNSHFNSFTFTIFSVNNTCQRKKVRCVHFEAVNMICPKQLTPLRQAWVDLIMNHGVARCDDEGVELWNDVCTILM